MNAVDLIAVVGPCAPEQDRYGRRLAAVAARAFIPASELAQSDAPERDGIRGAARVRSHAGAVVDFPASTRLPELIGAAAEHDGVRLTAIVCVLDAAHLLDDLARDDFLAVPGAGGTTLVAAALVIASQIEYASSVVLTNWEGLSTADLSMTMALICHLSPRARLRLDRRGGHPDAADAPEDMPAEQDRPGWVALLNGEFDPHMTDPRVAGVRYTQLRAFHPGRLSALLDRISAGDFGAVIRSGGFCRLATRPGMTGGWEQAGPTIALSPLRDDDRLQEDEDPLSFGQDLGFIGLDLDGLALITALDHAALSDAELAAGPRAWRAFPDPFPAWQIVPDRAD